MRIRATPLASALAALTGIVTLVAWQTGDTAVTSWMPGWRAMVPSSAFACLCLGIGLSIADRHPHARSSLLAVRAFALLSAILPVATLFEYVTGARLGVESWLGFDFHQQQLMLPYAGRMSAVSAETFLLLSIALAALTSSSAQATSVVRWAGGTALAMSWLAVLVASFDVSRMQNLPRFPGMAVPTIVAIAALSVGLLACSSHVMNHLRDADAEALVPEGLLLAGFVVPLALGRAVALIDLWFDPSLSAAVIGMTLAFLLTLIVWKTTGRIDALRQQRLAVLEQLEARVAERTRAFAEANERLVSSEERLKEADRRKDDFLATLAHELRNPLAPIRTSFHLLKNPSAPPDLHSQAHAVIDRQMAHLVRLIDDLLDVSRISAEKLQLRKLPVDMVQIARQVVDSAEPQTTRAQHRVHFEAPAGPVHVLGDETRLTQVITNLLNNANKYTPALGTITVAISSADGFAEITVADNGIGIPREFLPRLFEKFSQAEPAMERTHGGLGLGLALVLGIVTLHGGTVDVRSDGTGQGSAFTVRLPLAKAAEREEAPLPPPAARAVRPFIVHRVLVADDNADNTEMLATLLRHRGHIVETALDGEEALHMAEHFRPDIAFLDIGMPLMNGYDVCAKIRQEAWGRQMMVIAQTGWGQQHDRMRSATAGFDGHLVKPIDPAALDALLQ